MALLAFFGACSYGRGGSSEFVPFLNAFEIELTGFEVAAKLMQVLLLS